ncbi:hypothetical protein LAZ67_14002494 [Cordylochernes scorpioides]|uniref:Uncharacterized protein n=1 Tax=Cordylochernes scorpioides TaxID=51811 RepID=A0ABY6L839_9ARAC|nr:hypothetical protein LAZ67_14002494 [Cordylochernes scorpioides]
MEYLCNSGYKKLHGTPVNHPCTPGGRPQTLGNVTELWRSRRLQGRETNLEPFSQRIKIEDDHRATVRGSYLPCHCQRDPSTFSGDGNINPGQWLKEYERVSKYNRWDEIMKLANVVFYLNETAGRWFHNKKNHSTREDALKTHSAVCLDCRRILLDVPRKFRSQEHRRPRNPASHRSRRFLVSATSCSHYKGNFGGHIPVIGGKGIQTVDEILKFCRHLATVKQRRIGRTKFSRLSNVMPILCVDDSDNLAGLIRRIVREKIIKVFSAPEVVNPFRKVNALEQAEGRSQPCSPTYETTNQRGATTTTHAL